MKKKRLDDYTSSLCWRKKFLVMRLVYFLMVGFSCFGANFGERAGQNDFFGNPFRNVK